MPIFTRPDGSTLNVSASEIVRARPTVRNEVFGRPGHIGTALFKPKQLVLETIDGVGSSLKAETPTFAALHAPNNASIWFDAAKAKDAELPRNYENSENTNSVVVMGGVRQRLSESVQQAQAVIDAARAES